MKVVGYNKWLNDATTNAFKEAKYLNLAKGRVHYTDIGNPKGVPIIHFHGSPSGADVGLYFFEDFIEEGFRIITISRPGFLGTDLSLGKTIEKQADLYKDFIDKLGIKNIIVHAWSAGGPPAIKFAEKYPNDTRGMILFCALSTKWDHKISFFEKLFLSNFGMYVLYVLSNIFSNSVRRKSAEELGVDYNYLKRDGKKIKMLNQFLQITAPPSLRNSGSFNDIENYSNMKSFNFKNINAKTLLIFSPSDNQLDIKNGDIPAKELPNCKYLRFEYGGHVPQLDKEWQSIFNEMNLFIKTLI